MPDVLAVSLQIALGIGFPAVVIRKDLARLPPEKLARAWNDASLWAAIVAFGPIALLVHFARTRRSLWGVLLGLLWAVVAVLLSLLIATVAGDPTV